MKKWTLLFLMGWAGLLSGQTFDRLPVGFIKNGTTLANPATGGLNAPQLNAVDLDNDGITDLYIFDRIGNVHLPFLNVGTNDAPDYRFAPQFVPYFPPDVGNFVLLRDFNGDGAMDLFGHANQLTAPTSVKVYRGFYENGHLDFERMVFDSTDFLPFRDGVTNFRTLEIAEPDYPAFDDMDGDGDMDILTFDLTGAHVLFYRNMSQEEGFGNEKLLFDLADDCWGRFLEDMTSPDLILSGNIDECATGLTGGGTGDDRSGGLHPGSTLLTLDADQNGLTDLILGDIATPHLTLLSNFGTAQTAWITAQDGNFPNYNVPVEIPDFPSVFWLDLDGDGRRDLAAAPNNKNQTPNVEVIWRYKNTGSNEAPVFELQQKDFLAETMIDFGTGANPAFADVNADGLWDLVVGNETYFTGDGAGKDARLHLFLNVGTKSAPVFELTDDNWLNFKQFS
ncbi:MAG: VCBS repeat-containing protein, partial [Bacteroidetes bacterium]